MRDRNLADGPTTLENVEKTWIGFVGDEWYIASME
jgi:hypothetical protein